MDHRAVWKTPLSPPQDILTGLWAGMNEVPFPFRDLDLLPTQNLHMSSRTWI